MPTPLQDAIRAAMIGGGSLTITFDPALNGRAPGALDVYLHEIPGGVRIDQISPGEAARILWLPWKQGELTTLQPFSVTAAAANTLFFTYYLSGCKVFAVGGGPVWHIDAPVTVAEFWPQIMDNEWVEDNWPVGETQQVAYLHRAGQSVNLWDLSAYLSGPAPATYGQGDLGQATVGGIVNANHKLDFYVQASPWAQLKYAAQQLRK